VGFFSNFLSTFSKPSNRGHNDPQTESASADEANQAQPERRRRRRKDARRGTRVLIIDDSPTVAAVFSKFLASVGYAIHKANDAETGLEMAREHNIELIFLDIMLPGMNGFAALRHLRRDPRTRDIPVIMITGNEQALEQFYAIRISADGFMKKPFTRADLFGRIEQLLDNDMVPRHLPRNVESASEGAGATA